MRPLVCVFVLLLAAGNLPAQEDTLHSRIDERLTPVDAAVAVCSDTEFLRRVSLDLTGLPPDAEMVRAFIADDAADKRQRVIDELLESPQCDRHLTATFDLMLMERRRNQHVPQNAWHAWLLEQVRSRRPWNEIVSDILQADGDDPATRPAARFFLDRLSEPHLLTRDVGRIFFGRDMQCAQCHDHPLFDDYLQVDYQGLHAFLAPGYPVIRKVKQKDGDKEKTVDLTVHAEKAGNDLTFESVFFEGTKRRTGPRLPDDMSMQEDFIYPGEEYDVAPADGVKAVPKVSRRSQLAAMATSGDNRMFNENIANRLWAHMFGRGLVHPVDLHHFDNPPTDPELLRLLGEQIAAMNFDVRGFLREIALSRAYQRSFDQQSDLFELASAARSLLEEREQLQAQLEESVAAAETEYDAAIEAWETAQDALVPVASEVDTARSAYDSARKALTTAKAALSKATSELQPQQQALPSVTAAAAAARTAAEQIQDDMELKAASELLTKRVAELEASIAKLSAKVTELTTAVAGPETKFVAGKNALDESLGKLPPLEDALRQAEAVMLEKRRVMQQQKLALAAGEQKRETLMQMAGLPILRDAVTTAAATRTQREANRESAGQLLAARQVDLKQNQQRVTEMAQPLAEAEKRLTDATAVHEQRVARVTSFQAAIDAAAAAGQTVPDDEVIAEVTSKLSERLVALQTEMAESQTMVDASQAEMQQHQKAYDQAAEMVSQATAECDRCQQSVQQADAAVQEAQSQLAAAQVAVDSAVGSIVKRWSTDFTIASLKPLTPEQFCWSLLKVTGVYQRHYQSEADKLAKENPLSEEAQQDPQQVTAREREIEQKTYDALKSHLGTFVKFYGAAAGQPQNDFFATADQALFVANAGVLNSWVAPSGGNVTERVMQATDSTEAARELYLAVLNRDPSADEVAEVSTLLEQRSDDRAAVAKELVWGLMTSIEFRFNH